MYFVLNKYEFAARPLRLKISYVKNVKCEMNGSDNDSDANTLRVGYRQLEVERRTAKVHRPEIDVLPLTAPRSQPVGIV